MKERNKIVNFLEKQSKLIVGLWILIFVLMVGLFGRNFFSSLSEEISPPEGSEADNGNMLMELYFPEASQIQTHIIVAKDDNNNVLGADLARITQEVAGWANAEYPQRFKQIVGYHIFNGTTNDALKLQFVSADQSAAFVALTFDGEDDIQSEIGEEMREFIHSLDQGQLEIYTTGFQELRSDTIKNNEADLRRIDLIVIPLVFIAILILMRNWKYFFVTMPPIILSLGITFGLLERYVNFTDVTFFSVIPAILVNLTLGIGIDYSLFLLTRFQEERRNGQTVSNAVHTMMKYAGHTVFVSGLTLSISFLGLILFPFSILSSIGIAISTSILVLLVINLTFTPALLFLTGNWLERSSEEVANQEDETSNEASNETSTKKRGLWYRVARFSIKYNVFIIIIILVVSIPLSLQILDADPQSGVVFFLPSGSEGEQGFTILNDNFNAGSLSPMRVVIVPDSGTVYSSAVFNDFHTLIQSIVDQTVIEANAIFSHAWIQGQPMDFAVAQTFLDTSSPMYDTPTAITYRQLASTLVSSSPRVQDQAAIIQVVFPVDPSSPEARDLYGTILDIASSTFGDRYETGVTGQTAIDDSAISYTYSVFPVIAMLVIIAIYVLVGFMFKAAFLPARLLLTIALTMSFIFGAAIVVFQETTFLNRLFPVLDEVSVIFWVIPVMTSTIILGLGMDYDIFTIERIRENVWNGMENDTAIKEGLDKTGRIITGAGLILMIAFGGLMFSSSFVLKQFGFIMAFAVFLDTFVVRTILVPAIMSMGDKWNWWPSKPDL